MTGRTILLACLASLANAGCATQTPAPPSPTALAGAQVAATPWLSQKMADKGRFVLPDTLALPLWPGHSLAADCARDSARSACVVIGGERDRVDPQAVRDAYTTVLESQGWQQQWPGDPGMALLRTASAPQRCLQISFGVWDDGKSARIRLKPVLRFELDPSGVDCANPGAEPPFLTVIPGHRG